jgi:hypothetical protein
VDELNDVHVSTRPAVKCNSYAHIRAVIGGLLWAGARRDRRYERRCSALGVQVLCVSLKICSAICAGLLTMSICPPVRVVTGHPSDSASSAPRFRSSVATDRRVLGPTNGYELTRFPYAFLTQLSNVREFDRSVRMRTPIFGAACGHAGTCGPLPGEFRCCQ